MGLPARNQLADREACAGVVQVVVDGHLFYFATARAWASGAAGEVGEGDQFAEANDGRRV